MSDVSSKTYDDRIAALSPIDRDRIEILLSALERPTPQPKPQPAAATSQERQTLPPEYRLAIVIVGTLVADELLALDPERAWRDAHNIAIELVATTLKPHLYGHIVLFDELKAHWHKRGGAGRCAH